MTSLAALSLAACIAVAPGSDKILGRDLATAFPALAASAPDAEIALAPAPGVPRAFHATDIRILAARFHVDDAAPVEPFCVERPVAILDGTRLLEAMHRALPDARIEILEFSRQPAPQGEIEFPAAHLKGTPANSAGLWDGFVHYGGSRRFAIWARVKVLLTVTRVRAVADLLPGHAIEAAQLAPETVEEFPSAVPFAHAVAEVVGRWPRLAVRAGTSVRLDQLELSRDVMRGQKVQVEVRSGATRLLLEGIAEGSGCTGESILVVNRESHKAFRARIEGPGQVSVNAASPANGDNQ